MRYNNNEDDDDDEKRRRRFVILLIILIILAFLGGCKATQIFGDGSSERATGYAHESETGFTRAPVIEDAEDPWIEAQKNNNDNEKQTKDGVVNFCEAFNSGKYDWDDVNEIAKIISGRYGVPGTESFGSDPKIDRTTEEVIIKNYKNSGVDLKLSAKGTDEYNLVGKIIVDSKEVNYTYKVRIIGFNTDVLSDDAYGTGATRAGITFQFINLFRWDGLNERDAMVESGNYAGWGKSKARADLNNSSVIKRLENSDVIKTVDKMYLNAYNDKKTSISQDKLWLLSASEVFPYIGAIPYDENVTPKYAMTFDAESEVDSKYNGQYIWYKKFVHRANGDVNMITANMKKESNYTMNNDDYGSGGNAAWYLRSSRDVNASSCTFCTSLDGGITSRPATNEYGISPGFCI